jgi:hypothetical protein
MLNSEIWSKDLYRSPISILVDTTIREYDISKANISILIDKGIISQQQYEQLYNMPKQIREVSIGKFIGQNTEANKALKEGFQEARRQFVELNKLEAGEILSIRKDSFFIIGDPNVPYLQVSPHVVYRPDGYYTSFYKLGNLDIFYRYGDRDIYSIKGISDDALIQHVGFMLDFLMEVFYVAQTVGIEKSIIMIKQFHEDYCALRLPYGYYRRFDAQSKFDFKSMSRFSSFQADYLMNPNDIDMLDISYNEKLLRDLNGLYYGLYFATKKR